MPTSINNYGQPQLVAWIRRQLAPTYGASGEALDYATENLIEEIAWFSDWLWSGNVYRRADEITLHDNAYATLVAGVEALVRADFDDPTERRKLPSGADYNEIVSRVVQRVLDWQDWLPDRLSDEKVAGDIEDHAATKSIYESLGDYA